MKFKNENGEELSLDQILEDADYQAEFDKKVAKALEKAKANNDEDVKKQVADAVAKREDELRKNIQDEIDAKAKEAEENAKLTEAEKYKKELDKVNQKLAGYETEINKTNREKKMRNYIKEKGYDMDAIMDFVSPDSVTDANYEEKIDSINDKLNDRISKGVNAKLKDEGDKVLGGKVGKNNMPEFNFDFQSIKPEHK